MKLRHVYFALLVTGVILPYTLVLPWLLEHGLDGRLFFAELFANRISGSFGLDIFVSLAVLLIFAWFEIKRLKMPRGWLVFAAVCLGTLGAGVCCGFPLFLYLRQKHLDNLNDGLSDHVRD